MVSFSEVLLRIFREIALAHSHLALSDQGILILFMVRE